VNVTEAYVCPGCGEQLSIDGSDFLYWKQRGPRSDGGFTISFVPVTYGADEVVVHECTDPDPTIWESPTELGQPPAHPEATDYAAHISADRRSHDHVGSGK
jgi:hypothetical protein